jgi:parallel beta-helix repeat protein
MQNRDKRKEGKMKKGFRIIGGIVALLFLFSTAHATIWYVHPDSALNTIQAGLNSCANNDTVLVGPGTYYENILWPIMQGIHLISEFGPDTTIIDGDSIESVIRMADQVDTTAIIGGFTIQNGYAVNGGGIWCSNSHPVITNNVIVGNSTSADGAGIFLTGEAAPTIVWNIIKNNNSLAWGGGIYIFDGSSPYISRNVIIDNGQIDSHIRQKHDILEKLHCNNEQVVIEGRVRYSQRIENTRVFSGGGILITNNGGLPTSPIIVHNTINGNIAGDFGGGIFCNNASPDIRNNIITSNIDYGVYVQGDSLEISYNDVWNNTFEYGGLVIDGPGNIHDDPLFVDPGMENFHLQWGSPCIDAGDPALPMDPDSTVADMGVFYYDQTGIAEKPIAHHTRKYDFLDATICSGPIQLPKGQKCKVFDITGRVVEPSNIQAGIYFIEVDGVVVQKVVKVR